MAWTAEQKMAIEERDKNILVAAAAGSGKTAVLVERVKQLVLSGETGIDEMLVVTFTNAAASEMKEKITNAIRKELGVNTEAKSYLTEQLNKVYSANISTFHAFALEIIRKHFGIVDIEPLFKICDESQSEILKAEAIDDVFQDLFRENDSDFMSFLDAYASPKDLDGIKKTIISIYEKLRSIPDPFETLDKSIEAIEWDLETFKSTKGYAFMISDIKAMLHQAKRHQSMACKHLRNSNLDRLAANLEKDITALDNMLIELDNDNIQGFADIINTYSAVRLVANKAEKDVYNGIKEQVSEAREAASKNIKKIKEIYTYQPFEEFIAEMNSTYSLGKVLKSIIYRFHDGYTRLKTEKACIDFSDIEHYALKALSVPEVSQEYREKFKHIFIDEYQDSNIIQETIIGLIARDNNVFMVGDVKQSIYKFRLAEPEIFQSKYQLYKGSKAESMAIDLNMNFRSKAGVIDTTNQQFRAIMENYDSDAELKKGVSYQGELEYPSQLYVVEQNIESEDMEIAELKKAELEAMFAAKIINDAVASKMKIYDTKVSTDNERTITYKDIVILMRGTKNSAEAYKKIFNRQGIPIYAEENDGYFDTIEIDRFMNLLKVIDNKRQDIPLISTLYSQIFGYTTDELADIRIRANERQERRISFAEAFLNAAEDEDFYLKDKISETLFKLNEWRRLSRLIPLTDFMWRVLQESGYYVYIGALPGGMQRQANLRALIDKAESFSETESGIYRFLRYVEALRNKKIPTGQVSVIGEGENAVRIMTIHKSKGLDFPMVILAGLGKNFNKRSDSSKISFHKDIGIGLNIVDTAQHWKKKTLLQNIIERKQLSESMEEEVRILYVAYTRAIDKLVLLGTIKNAGEELVKYRNREILDINNAGNYFDMILPTMQKHLTPILCKADMLMQQQEEEKNKISELKEKLQTEDGKVSEAIKRRLEYQYPYKEDLILKSKYSVSELNIKADREHIVNVPESLIDKEDTSLTTMELGSIHHLLLEHVDMAAAGSGREEKAVTDTIKMLVEGEYITQEAADCISKSVVVTFLKSNLANRMKKAADKGLLFKEQPFTLHTEVNGHRTLIQGVIDCCFEEEGEFVLVDYKTNRMKNHGEAEQERIRETYNRQMELYQEAIEKIRKKPVKEKYLYMLKEEIIIKMT